MKKYRAIWIVLALTLTFFGFRLYYRLTDDFKIAHITCESLKSDDKRSLPLSEGVKRKILAVLDQPFTYIGKGAQGYAFLSEDKHYVLKFFKFKHLKPSKIVHCLPNVFFKSYKKKLQARKTRLIESVLNGYFLAYQRHRQESGLVYVHLKRGGALEKSVTLFDKIGRRFVLDIDDFFFVLQKKVKTARQVFQKALDQRDFSVIKKRIDQLMELYFAEYNKGIFDRDHGFLHNVGFVNNCAIHFDVGKLSENQEMKNVECQIADLAILKNRFRSWLKKNYPNDCSFCLEYWDKKTEQILILAKR